MEAEISLLMANQTLVPYLLHPHYVVTVDPTMHRTTGFTRKVDL